MDEPRCNCMEHAEVLKSIKQLEEGLKDAKKDIIDLKINESKRDEKIDNILEIVKDLKTKFEKLAVKPGEQYNLIKSNIITAIITGGTTILIASIFYKLTGFK